MASPEIIDILQQMFLCLNPGTWFIVDDSDEFFPSLCKAVSLNANRYKNLLLLCGIMFRFGDNLRFSLQKLQDIKISLQENVTINITRVYLHRGGKNRFFVCVGVPTYTSPKAQLRSNQQLHATWQDNQLAAAYLVLLDRLSNEIRADFVVEDVVNDVPMLDEEQNEEEHQIDEEMLVGEERDEVEQQERIRTLPTDPLLQESAGTDRT